MKVVNLSAIWN